MASLSICHLGLWLRWQILLNLVKYTYQYDMAMLFAFKLNYLF